MSEEHILELLPAYTVGCLDSIDLQKVNDHLDSCESCRMGLEAYRRVMDDLPLKIALCEPPSMIREKILLKAQQEEKIPNSQRISNNLHSRAREFVFAWIGGSTALLFVIVVLNLILWVRIQQIEIKCSMAK